MLACIGDHDNFAYRDRGRSLREVREALARRGIQMLDNEVREIRVGGATIAVILATNNYVSHIDRETTRALLARARGADLEILLAHQPGGQLVADARRGRSGPVHERPHARRSDRLLAPVPRHHSGPDREPRTSPARTMSATCC